MIKQLRRKFVLINMSMVSIVLIIVFLTIGFLSYQRLKDESVQAMDRALSVKLGALPPPPQFGSGIPEKHEPLVPVFILLVDDAKKVTDIYQMNIAITAETSQALADKVLATSSRQGVLIDYKLRYMVRETPEGTRIAYAYMTREFETMTTLTTTMLFVGLCALTVLLVASIYLARWSLKPAEVAWEKQKRFVADASHELKTPLTVILANSGILLSHKEDTIANQVKWVEYTQAEAQRLKILVDDLLFLAKYDAAHQPEMTPQIDLGELTWSSVLPFESVAFEQDNRVETHIDTTLMIRGNAGQLKQLIVILMDNAVKYSNKGEKITVSLTKKGDDVALSINNKGSVISPEQIPQLFDRFYRVDSARTRDRGGYGLGLAIAQTIVETHSGQIQVESNAEVGTTFTVTFPQAK